MRASTGIYLLVNRPMPIVFTLFLSVSVAAIAIMCQPMQEGLRGEYYDNPDWQGVPLLTVRDRVIDLYRKGVEFPALDRQYSIQWKGVLVIPTSGDYHFRLLADESAEILLQEQSLLTNHQTPGQEVITPVHLARGFYPLTIRYRQGNETDALNIAWQRPGHAWEAIPVKALLLTTPTPSQQVIGTICDILLATGKLLGGLAVIGCGAALLAQRRRIWIAVANHALIVILIFLAVFSVHFWGSRTSTSFDSMWTLATSLSLIREKNTDLDEYRPLLQEQQYYAVEQISAHYYPVSPIGTPLLAMPFVYVLDRFLDRGLAMDLGKIFRDQYGVRGGLEIWIASMLIALSTMGIYAISYLQTKKIAIAALVACIFAFCTSAWSTASRALWQHGPSALMLTCVLYLYLLAQAHPRYAKQLIPLIGLPLAFSLVIRPTNSLSLLLLSLVFVFQYRKQALAYSAFALTVAIPFFVFNFQVYHSALSSYYQPQRIGSSPWFFEALVGNLFSPARGLFVFSPILVFALYGVFLKIKTRQMTIFDDALALIILGHWIVISTFPHWWGGHSYGPRFFTDLLPYFMYFLLPAIIEVQTLTGGKRIMLRTIFAGTLLISLLIHFRGATNWDVHAWNTVPVNVDEQPARIWDWCDIQFLRGLGK